jgi:hypothetical protein
MTPELYYNILGTLIIVVVAILLREVMNRHDRTD